MRARYVAALLVLAACGETSSRRLLVYDLDANGKYALVEAEVSTLRSIKRGRGDVAFLRGGGSVVAASAEPKTEAEVKDALTVRGDGAPSISYVVEDGLVVPWDFDSVMMLSLYHHLETASAYFGALGVSLAEVRRLPVYYNPQLSSGLLGPVPLFTDNAAYAFTLDAFLIPPRLALSGGVPLFANRGVIVHEYSHAVFNRLVHHDRRAPRYLLDSWPELGINEMRSLDEGIADTFAALALGDPDFISPSIPADVLGASRDVSMERFYDDTLLANAEGDTASYDPYPLGSVVASAIWALVPSVGADTLGAALVTALRQLGDTTAETVDFRLTQLFDQLVLALPPAEQSSACLLFHTRLTAVETELSCVP